MTDQFRTIDGEKVCLDPSPPVAGVTYFCQSEPGHEGLHRDDLGVIFWDDSTELRLGEPGD